MTETSQKHPKGLYFIYTISIAERFGYYGMRALFTLYMGKALLMDKELSSIVYGNYTGLVYLMPLVGGYVADKYWGMRRSVFLGSLLIMLGQLLLFFSALYFKNTELSRWLMYCGLGGLIFGNGFFKPNVSTFVGQLYERGDKRLDAAYTIFYMGVNIGALFAPIICGFLGDTGNPADFKWGFLVSAFVSAVCLIIYVLYNEKYLITPDGKPLGIEPAGKETFKKEPNEKSLSYSLKEIILWILGASVIFIFLMYVTNSDLMGSLIYAVFLIVPIFVISDKSLTKIERERIGVVFIITFFVIFFFLAYEQAGLSLTYFADEQTNRSFFGWTMPASWFQSFNAFFIVILAPLFAKLWVKLGQKNMEPASPVKQALGLFLLSLGYLWIAFGVKNIVPGIKVSIIWLTGLYFIHTLGELCLSPIGLSLVNRLSPIRFASIMMGVWYLANSAANKLAGAIGGLYPEAGKTKTLFGIQITNLYEFFMIFVIMSAVAAVILFGLSKRLQKLMHGIR